MYSKVIGLSLILCASPIHAMILAPNAQPAAMIPAQNGLPIQQPPAAASVTYNAKPLHELCAISIIKHLIDADLSKALALEMTSKRALTNLLIATIDKKYRSDLINFLLVDLIGHTKCVRYVSWRPDGRYAISIGDEDAAYLWDIRDWSGIKPIPLRGHGRGGKHISWSTDGSLACLATYNYSLKVWDATNIESTDTKELTGHTNYIHSTEWCPRGRHLLLSASSDHSIRLWDLDNNGVQILSDHTDETCHISWHPNGTHFLSGRVDGTVRLWSITDLHNPSSIVIFAKQPTNRPSMQVKFSPDGTKAVVGVANEEILLFDMHDLNAITHSRTAPNQFQRVCGYGHLRQIRWRGDSTYFATIIYGDEAPAILYDASGTNPPPQIILGDDSRELDSACWSPCGNFLAVGGGRRGAHNRPVITIWDLRNLTQPSCITLINHSNAIMELSWQPQGDYLLSASLDHKVTLIVC